MAEQRPPRVKEMFVTIQQIFLWVPVWGDKWSSITTQNIVSLFYSNCTSDIIWKHSLKKCFTSLLVSILGGLHVRSC